MTLRTLPFDDDVDKLVINNRLAETYALDKWAKGFSLMTAGYRDQLDPDDIANPEVAINTVTMAILGEAKARVFLNKTSGHPDPHVHLGGETRAHTQTFIRILARVYAARGFIVHLRTPVDTTPIWYSSFGVFYENFQSGDNLTASHSQYFKGGWKPMDGEGKQLVEEEEAIIREVRDIVASRATIPLAPFTHGNILKDFDVDEAYITLMKSMIGDNDLQEIHTAGAGGFRCSVCTVGGSMKNTSERLFRRLGIPTGPDEIVNYFYDDEHPQYHGIGQVNGENHGVDPTKKEIYRNIGAQDMLLNGRTSLVFIWDPDGDRFNMVTIAPKHLKDRYENLGLEVEDTGHPDLCIVYFTPNQTFLMLTAYRIHALKRENRLKDRDWFLASSVTTSRALNELAEKEGLPIVHVRVGFKHWGTFAQWLETRKSPDEPYITALGERFSIGPDPRLILMCEESGGAILGGDEPIQNRAGNQKIIAMREKDAFQFGLMTLCIGASLFNTGKSFAEYYCELIDAYAIQNRYFDRYDQKLYDERLTGAERATAKTEGEARRDRIMNYFNELVRKYPSSLDLDGVRNDIQNRLPKGAPALPLLKSIRPIGSGGLLEGTFMQFETLWFVIRASGTDAVLRYYINGRDKDEIQSFQESVMSMTI